MYHQTINAFTNVILAATLLSCILSSLTDACGSKSKPEATTSNPVRPPVQSFRLRREGSMGEYKFHTVAPESSIMVDELARLVEQGTDNEVSVIEWTLEGHSVEDFWKLLNIFDKDGNDRISKSEIVKVQTELSNMRF